VVVGKKSPPIGLEEGVHHENPLALIWRVDEAVVMVGNEVPAH